jgi:hypothetical protein
MVSIPAPLCKGYAESAITIQLRCPILGSSAFKTCFQSFSSANENALRYKTKNRLALRIEILLLGTKLANYNEGIISILQLWFYNKGKIILSFVRFHI